MLTEFISLCIASYFVNGCASKTDEVNPDIPNLEETKIWIVRGVATNEEKFNNNPPKESIIVNITIIEENKVFVFYIKPSDTIHEIKEKIFPHTNIPVDYQKLVSNRIELDKENKTIADFIRLTNFDNSNIILYIYLERVEKKKVWWVNGEENNWEEVEEKRPKGAVIIYILPEKGNTFVIYVNPDNTIKNIKKQILDQKGYPIHNQVLKKNISKEIFNDNDQTIGEAVDPWLQDEMTILLQLKNN